MATREYTDKTGEAVTVRLDAEKRWFEITTASGEAAGQAHFRSRDGDRIFYHTVVDEAFGGRGLGTALVRGAVEETRSEGEMIVAVCPMVKGFLEKNADEFAGAYRLPTPDDLAWLRTPEG